MSETQVTETDNPAEEPAEIAAESDDLADLDDIEFDLDEVESKIAPLALALKESRSW